MLKYIIGGSWRGRASGFEQRVARLKSEAVTGCAMQTPPSPVRTVLCRHLVEAAWRASA